MYIKYILPWAQFRYRLTLIYRSSFVSKESFICWNWWDKAKSVKKVVISLEGPVLEIRVFLHFFVDVVVTTYLTVVQSTSITEVCNLLYQTKKAKTRRQRKKPACIVIISNLGTVSAEKVRELCYPHSNSCCCLPPCSLRICLAFQILSIWMNQNPGCIKQMCFQRKSLHCYLSLFWI